MTYEQLNHLRLIDAHLTKLLKNAEKRTPGEWVEGYDNDTGNNSDSFWEWWEAGPARCEGVKGKADAAFIAACAGNAEAGWRSTKAVVAVLIDCNPTGNTGSPSSQLLDSILTAWPLESLKL